MYLACLTYSDCLTGDSEISKLVHRAYSTQCNYDSKNINPRVKKKFFLSKLKIENAKASSRAFILNMFVEFRHG